MKLGAKKSSPTVNLKKAGVALPGVSPKSSDPAAALSNFWQKHPKLKTLPFDHAVEAYEQARVTAKSAEEQKESARGEVMTALQLAGIGPNTKDLDTRVTCRGFEVYYTIGEGRVSAEKFKEELLKDGVDADKVERAWALSKGKGGETLQMRKLKTDEEKGGGK